MSYSDAVNPHQRLRGLLGSHSGLGVRKRARVYVKTCNFGLDEADGLIRVDPGLVGRHTINISHLVDTECKAAVANYLLRDLVGYAIPLGEKSGQSQRRLISEAGFVDLTNPSAIRLQVRAGEDLAHHHSDARETFLRVPKIVDGEWSGPLEGQAEQPLRAENARRVRL